jgi:hypothetical protein
VVRKALELGFSAVSITDHDSVRGIGPAMKAAEATPLEIIPGVELSCAGKKRELHMLGYFIDHEDRHLVRVLEKMKSGRIRRMKKMVSCLRDKGLDISADDLFDPRRPGTVGRLHLAREMVERGLVSNRREAFRRYIGDGRNCHVRHERMDAGKAIDIIRKAGGVPVLAHPGTTECDEEIPELVSRGLRGLEVYHSKHYSSTCERYLKMAGSLGLLVTGGSDCHGRRDSRSGIGSVRLDCERVEALREESRAIRAKGPGGSL